MDQKGLQKKINVIVKLINPSLYSESKKVNIIVKPLDFLLHSNLNYELVVSMYNIIFNNNERLTRLIRRISNTYRPTRWIDGSLFGNGPGIFTLYFNKNK